MEGMFATLRPLVHLLINRPGWVVAAGVLLAAAGGWQAGKLRIDGDFAKLIPSRYPSVQALERLRQTVGGESDVAVILESPSFDANRRLAEALIPQMLSLRNPGSGEVYFTHVDYRRDVGFLEANALYLATDAELDSLEHYLNRQMEEARLEANPFYFDLDDEGDSGADVPDSTADALNAAYARLVGTSYPISVDSTTMVLRFYPSGPQTDVTLIADVYRDVQALVDSLEPASYHPEMQVTPAGRMLRQLVEVRAVRADVQDSFGTGVMIVLLIVTLYFSYKNYQARAGHRFSSRVLRSEMAHMPVTALLIGVPLLASLAWTFGLAYQVYGSLNLMTSTLGLVLFGLGIDYGIHFYGRYAEERGHGRSVPAAIEATFMNTGQALIGTAVTTAAAFFLLMIADFRGFSEFGFIAGVGILLALVAMLVMLPALLVLFERLHLLNLTAHSRPIDPPAVARMPGAPVPFARGILFLAAIGVVASIGVVPRVAFEYDFGALDPVYAEYQTLQHKVRRVYDDRGRRNPAYVTVDDPDDVPAVEAALRAHMAADSLTPTIRDVESFQARFPLKPDAQQAKLARLARIRAMLDDPFLSGSASTDLSRLRRAASTTEPIPLEAIPDVVKAPFVARDGTLGRLLIIYPAVGLSDGRQSIAFSDDVGTIVTAGGEIYHAGSTALVAADMLRLMRKEAPLMVGLTVALIVILKLILLRSVRSALLAILPLMAGFLCTFGLMVLFGIDLNFYNLVVLPAILGIGDDAGMHIVHRYIEEGAGSIRRVLRSTGEHIAICALTTMVGFAGLLLSFSPGMRSIGLLALLGIGTTLIAALIILPAFLLVLEERLPTWSRSAGRPQVDMYEPDVHRSWPDRHGRIWTTRGRLLRLSSRLGANRGPASHEQPRREKPRRPPISGDDKD